MFSQSDVLPWLIPIPTAWFDFMYVGAQRVLCHSSVVLHGPPTGSVLRSS